MANGRLLVAVVTYQSAEVLPALLESLADGLAGVDEWRLIVADNASTDDSAGIVRLLAPHATVIEMGGNLGYAAGINACTARAYPDEDLLILNADVRLASGCALALMNACSAGHIGVAVPLVTKGNGSPEATLRRKPTAVRTFMEALLGSKAGRYGEQLAICAESAELINADWANGAVLFIPAAVRTKVGPWQEDLFLYSEEVDYCRRVTDAGWTVTQVPQARAIHKGGEAASAPQLWAQLITNKVVHVARWEDKRSAHLVWLALVLAQLIRLPLRRRTHRRALRELMRGRKQLVAGIPTNPAANPAFRARIPTGIR